MSSETCQRKLVFHTAHEQVNNNNDKKNSSVACFNPKLPKSKPAIPSLSQFLDHVIPHLFLPPFSSVAKNC